MNIPTPIEIDDATLAFPASALSFMPAMKDIPEDFRDETPASAPWYRLQNIWFSLGFSEYFSFIPAEVDGTTIDPNKAFRQLSAIQRSFAPKHEHKMAAVAWLSSIWMEAVIYGAPDQKLEEHYVAGEATLEEWIEHFRKETS